MSVTFGPMGVGSSGVFDTMEPGAGNNRVVVGSGGIQFGGTAPVITFTSANNRTLVGSGGIQFGGTAATDRSSTGPTSARVSQITDASLLSATWLMTNGRTGAPFEFSQWANRSVQVFGTFGAGGTLRWEGSNDGVNYSVLTDPQGNNLDFTAAKIEAVTETTWWVRPRVTGGDGTTTLTVILFARRAEPFVY